MKALRIILTILLITNYQSLITTYAQIAINSDGASPDASAMLEITSADKGILIPRMDSTARNTIATPANGLMVYDSTTISFWYYDNSQWNEIRNGSDILSSTDLVNSYSLSSLDCIHTAGNLEIGGTPVRVIVSGDYAYVIDQNTDDLKVIDVTNPSNATTVGTVAVGGNPTGIAISGNYAYVVDGDSEILKIIDISDATNPSETGSIVLGAEPLNVAIIGNYAYVLGLEAGLSSINNLEVIDISDAANPALVTKIGTAGSTPIDIEFSGNYAFILDQNANEIKVLDITTPTSPSFVHHFALGSLSTDIEIAGNYAFVSSSGTLKVIDISNPLSLSNTGSINVGLSAAAMSVSGDYVYLIDNFYDSLQMVDISDPTNPLFVTDYGIGSDPTSIAVSGDYAYVVDKGSNDLKIIEVDACDIFVSINPENGELTTTVEEATDEDVIVDNLGNHSATENIQLLGKWLTNDGDDEGISIDDDGNVNLSGQLTVTDTVNLSSALIVNGKDLANTAFTSENGITTANNNSDDFVFGMDVLDYGGSDSDFKFFFDKNKGAFRSGRVSDDSWDDTNRGEYSVAFGDNTIAPSLSEAVFGGFNTEYVLTMPGCTSCYNIEDRLFVIGNGTDDANRSDAMIVYKSGNTEINGNVTIRDTLTVNDEATFHERIFIKRNIGGLANYPFTIENLNNSTNGYNNAIQIIAGQNTTEFNVTKSAYLLQFATPDGTEIGAIRQDAAGSIAFNTTSDIRLKTNIQPTQYSLSDILKIQIRDYNYKNDASKTPQTGFLAQQLHEVFPIAVTEGGEDAKTNPWTVDYSKMTPLLVKGMQEQQKVIENQQAEIEALKSRNQALEIQINKIQALEAAIQKLQNEQ